MFTDEFIKFFTLSSTVIFSLDLSKTLLFTNIVEWNPLSLTSQRAGLAFE